MHLSNNIEAIDRIRDGDELVDDTIEEISLKVLPTKEETTGLADGDRAAFLGMAPSLIGLLGTNGSHHVDVSQYRTTGKVVNLAGTNAAEVRVAQGDTIGRLSITGKVEFITNAATIEAVEIVSKEAIYEVVSSMAQKATLLAVNDRRSFLNQYAGKTDLDFSKVDLGSVDKTAAAIKDLFTSGNDAASAEYVPIATIQSMKIGSSVLSAVMSKMSLTNLSSFSALKRLDIVGTKGIYQTTSLTKSDLPESLEEFYSKNLVVRRGTLSADLGIDRMFAAAEVDLSELDLNGQQILIAHTFSPSAVDKLRLNPGLLSVDGIQNLIAADSKKSIIVSGGADGALNTANLQNVGTIDLRAVTGATSFSAVINVDGNNTNLSHLYLPSGFDLGLETLTGVDDGEVTVHISGAYADAITLDLDGSYDNVMLDFSAVTGNGRFQVPASVRGLVLSNGVSGVNVDAEAVANEFNLSELASLRHLSGLPNTATVLRLNNHAASSALVLNLTAATHLETLQLNNSKIAQLSLPATATLTNGGGANHLDLSSITDLAAISGLDDLLLQGVID